MRLKSQARFNYKEWPMHRAIAACCLFAVSSIAQTNFPPPIAPANNLVTQNKALLGMALFFEEQMSSSSTVACATCHDFAHGGVDPRALTSVHPGHDGTFATADDIHGSPGISLLAPGFALNQLFGHPAYGFGPQVTPRRSPTVINSGYHTHLAYDGSKLGLEHLVHAPPINPIEMGHLGRTWPDVAADIAAATPLRLASNLPQRLQTFIVGRTYPDLFQLAFGSPQVTPTTIKFALASYLRTLNSDQSKWDQFLNGNASLTQQEQQGLTLFTSPAAGAASCHSCHGDFEQRVLAEGPVAGQMTMVQTGYYGSPVPTRLLFHNIGVRPNIEDSGRQSHTGRLADAGRFRVASLRNVELTAPYFHNGSAETLHDVIDFYDRGGDFHANQAAGLTPRAYTVADKDALVAILRTLTDPRVTAGVAPFDRPLLGSQNGKLAQSFGTGMTTNAGTLTARAPFAPLLGDQQFSITLSGVTAGTLTFLMWDTAPSQVPGPANLSLARTGAFQWFGTGPATWMMSMPSTGVALAPLPLPNNPGLRNLTLYGQWLALEPSGAWPVATSNGLRIELQ